MFASSKDHICIIHLSQQAEDWIRPQRITSQVPHWKSTSKVADFSASWRRQNQELLKSNWEQRFPSTLLRSADGMGCLFEEYDRYTVLPPQLPPFEAQAGTAIIAANLQNPTNGRARVHSHQRRQRAILVDVRRGSNVGEKEVGVICSW